MFDAEAENLYVVSCLTQLLDVVMFRVVVWLFTSNNKDFIELDVIFRSQRLWIS